MSYIGRQPQIGNFQICDAISTVNNQAAYTMQVGSVNVLPETAQNMIVSLNGVIQKPNSSYTVAGAVITFSSALVTGDVINFIQILGSVLDLGVPSDGTVTSGKIANDAVTLAKMASGTDGNIISYDTSGNPVAVATGNAGQFLKSAGAGAVPSFATIPAGGSIIKLQTQTASSSSTITFSSTYLTTTYKKYYLDYTDIVISSDGGNIAATVSENNGSSYTTSGYQHWRIISTSGTSNNTIASSGNANNSNLLMIGTGVGLGTGADESGSGRMTIFNPFSADAKLFICEGLNFSQSGQLVQQNIYQGLLTSTIINNIKITPNTGTIVSGIFTLYGVTT